MSEVIAPRFPKYVFRGSLALFLITCFFMGQMGPVGKSMPVFAVLYVVAFLFLWGIFKYFPKEWAQKKQLILIFVMAITCRFVFIYFPPSNDINRYVWEGYVFNHGFNPYVHAPADPVLTGMAENIFPGINHKDFSAAYPPLSMLYFALLASFSISPLFFKSMILLFDVMLIPFLALIVRSRKISLKYVLIYALNPLVLVFMAGEGHLDALQMFFVVVCLFCFEKEKYRSGFLSLGCAIMCKYFALVMLPFMINRNNWKQAYLVFIPLIAYLPFMDSNAAFLSSLITFGSHMHYNDAMAAVLRLVFGKTAVWVNMGFVIACAGVIFLLVHDRLRSSYLMIGAVLLFLPTLHPWYLVLITPFLVFFPSRAWLYLHLGVVFTFPVFRGEYLTGVFQEVHWLKLMEYFPFYAILIYAFLRGRHVPRKIKYRHVETVSVVIPTLNAAETLTDALPSVQNQNHVLEVVGVDAGSIDHTRKIFEAHNIHVIYSPIGRGIQMNNGVKHCQGDVIFLMHGDCRVIPGTFARIIEVLNQCPECIGGSLGMHYERRSVRGFVLAALNNIRARWTHISFGDQGQFFRKEALKHIKGFPNQMLMEDIELSFRLKENGKMCFIPNGIMVLKSRWDHENFFTNFKRDVLLCLTYLVKRRLGIGDPVCRDFYVKYYGKRKDLINEQ